MPTSNVGSVIRECDGLYFDGESIAGVKSFLMSHFRFIDAPEPSARICTPKSGRSVSLNAGQESSIRRYLHIAFDGASCGKLPDGLACVGIPHLDRSKSTIDPRI